MNNLKLITVGCSIALSMTSLDSLAATSRAAGLSACAEAIVTELGSSQGSPLDYSMSPDSEMSSAALGRREVFHLDLRSPQTDDVVARADCIVNRKGQVQRIIDVPIDAENAEVRAKIALQ